MLSPTQAETINQLLRASFSSGPARRPSCPNRQVAGKTGTTENYGDAWFVGYTPQYVTAVWVGYPDKLIPMTTEFHGKPVAGGTFPALIWKAFMQKALAKVPPETSPHLTTATQRRSAVVNRGGTLERDDGVCRNTVQLEFFGGQGPERWRRASRTRSRSPTPSACRSPMRGRGCEGQPLTPQVVYKPARTGQRLGIVVGQLPRRGTASAGDQITIVLRKSLHDVVPNVVGLSLQRARTKLARAEARRLDEGAARGKVVKQSVPAHTASAPGEKIRLTVARNGRLTNREPARP